MHLVISSLQNQQIKNIKLLLRKPKARKAQEAFVIEGIKMFEEARLEDNLIKAYFSESFYNRKNEEDIYYFQALPYEVIEDSVFNKLSETSTPQGVLAIAKKPKYELADFVRKESKLSQFSTLLLLENIQDPGNLGTVVRTAEAAGIVAIILSKDCVDILSPKVVRSTMGSIYRMPFVYVEDFQETLLELKKNNFSIYASHLDGKYYYDEISYDKRVALLIGNESRGITEESAKKADSLVKIPMEGKVESLNAGVAASIMMYEIFRRNRL